MQVLALCTVVLAAAVPGGLATGDLFCDCRLQHQKDWSFALHCTREQGGSSGISCKKDRVPDVPRGYHYVPGYALVKFHRTFRTWAAAKKTCEDEGAQLAIPRDSYAYEGLKQLFPKVKGLWYAFLGISDQASEGVFTGVDGRPVSHLPWQPNQPDNYRDEDCVDVNDDGLLNDARCGSLSPFFCERRLAVSVPDNYSWFEDAGRFYKLHTEEKAYIEAAAVCRSESAALAVPDTYSRALALLRLMGTAYGSYLVGFTDEAAEGDFVTETGRHLKDMEFQLWANNEPSNNGQGQPENCLSLSGRGEYSDVRCGLELPFLCEIAPI